MGAYVRQFHLRKGIVQELLRVSRGVHKIGTLNAIPGTQAQTFPQLLKLVKGRWIILF